MRTEILRAKSSLLGAGGGGHAHEQRTMGSGVITIPPHNFEHASRWCYRLQEIKKHEFGLASFWCGLHSKFHKYPISFSRDVTKYVVRRTTNGRSRPKTATDTDGPTRCASLTQKVGVLSNGRTFMPAFVES
jgi:hypothetical protein